LTRVQTTTRRRTTTTNEKRLKFKKGRKKKKKKKENEGFPRPGGNFKQEQQDAENPFLDPPFSRIKICS
jgi:hypothetical protein